MLTTAFVRVLLGRVLAVVITRRHEVLAGRTPLWRESDTIGTPCELALHPLPQSSALHWTLALLHGNAASGHKEVLKRQLVRDAAGLGGTN